MTVMPSPLPIVVVGHHLTAAHATLTLAAKGHQVLWITHVEQPSIKIFSHEGIDTPYETIPPSFYRELSPHEGEVDQALHTHAIWKHHRMRLEPEAWTQDLARDFVADTRRQWLHPSMMESHFSKQLRSALAAFISAHHINTLQTASTLETFLSLQKHRSGGLLHSQRLQAIEKAVREKKHGPIEIIQSRLEDLVFENNAIWGVVLSNHRGVIPCRSVVLMDHSAALQHLHPHFQPTIATERIHFNFVLRTHEVPSGFAGEALLLPFHDLPLEAPHALFLKRMSPSAHPFTIVGARMDFPYRNSGVSRNTLRHALYHSLAMIEERMFPRLTEHVVHYNPALEKICLDSRDPARTSFVYYSFHPKKNQPETMMKGLFWYGPEHWGHWGSLVNQNAALHSIADSVL